MTIKGRVNRKWVSTDKYKDGFDRIFGKKESEDGDDEDTNKADVTVTSDRAGGSDVQRVLDDTKL